MNSDLVFDAILGKLENIRNRIPDLALILRMLDNRGSGRLRSRLARINGLIGEGQ
jgi:hypothetical protein